MGSSQEEIDHWRSVLKAFDGYIQYHLSANHARRMSLLTLPKAEKEMYELIGYREKIEAVDEGIRRNSEFIDEMIANPVFSDMLSESTETVTPSHVHGESHSHSHDPSRSHSSSETHSHAPPTGPGKKVQKGEKDGAQERVRSTLRSFVRDWSDEGETERKACYDPIISALEAYFPLSGDDGAVPSTGGRRARGSRSEVKVLIPGCGLGRLAMEIAARGFYAQGNEFNAYMLIASDWVLNQTSRPKSHAIFPYLHSFSNHITTESHLLRSIQIPDVCPKEVFGQGQPGPFSLVAGDFEEIYGPKNWGLDKMQEEDEGREDQRGQWGAVVTCFFIDCARNVLNYLRIIHEILEEDGIWINLGPLLWHFENSPTSSSKGESSIELSLNEVKELAKMIGFDIREEKMVQSTYTGIPEGMLKHEYNAAFWVATKTKPKSKNNS